MSDTHSSPDESLNRAVRNALLADNVLDSPVGRSGLYRILHMWVCGRDLPAAPEAAASFAVLRRRLDALQGAAETNQGRVPSVTRRGRVSRLGIQPLQQSWASTGDPEAWDVDAMRQALDARRRAAATARQVRIPTRQGVGRVAKLAAAVVGVVGLVLALGIVPSAEHNASITYKTHRGQSAVVSLADGSTVVLAPQTTLIVPRQSLHQKRTAILHGEAYFRTPDRHNVPFIVQTGVVRTRMLGTEFFVRYYSGDQRVRVGVKSGKVSVVAQTPHRPNMTLTAGMIGLIDDSLATVRATDNAGGETAWLNNEIAFTETPVPDVLATLTRWYGYEFRYTDSAIVRGNITAWINIQSSARALATLEQVLNVSLYVVGDTVTLLPRRTQSRPQDRHVRPYDVWTPSREVGR